MIMIRKHFAAVSIIVLICASLASAYTSGNASNDASSIPDTNNMSEFLVNTTSTETENVTEAMPDLVVTSIEAPDRLYINSSTAIDVTVENIGEQAAASFYLALKANETEIDNKTINALPAGETSIINFTWTPQNTGLYILTAVADPENTINESNETNNRYTINVTVIKELKHNITVCDLSQTDLKVVEVETAETFFAGELNPVKAQIKNEGAVARNFSVSFNVNGCTGDTRTIPSLGFNMDALVTFGWVPESEGDYRLNITVDPGNAVAETNETNNHEEKEVHVNPTPSWQYEKNITVENPLSYTLHDYPVLMKLDPSIFNYSEVRYGGEDITFKYNDNEPIPYWVELWNRSGESRIWLRLDGVSAGRHKLNMYWNASDIPPRSDGYLVFDFFDDFECAECFDSWSRDCVRYGVDTACNFSLSGATPDNSSYAARITVYKWADCIGIIYKNMSIVQPRLEFWMRIEAERNERLRTGVVIGDIAADNYSRVFEADNVTDWHLVDVNLTEFVGRNADFGFFSENNWWDYNVTFSVDNIRLRESESREPFVDFGLADVVPMNILPRYRNLYAEFPNQIYVNITNRGTADARNFSVFFNASDEEGNETLHSQCISLLHKNTTTLVFVWESPHAGNYSLSVHVDTGNCVEEANETNNVIEKEVYVNPATEWWGFAFKEDMHLKPQNGESIENATVLLTLDPSIFDYTKTNPDGSDVRIKDENGTDLPYWIVEWSTSGESQIWFRADVPSAGTTVHLCYGNSSAPSGSNASAVSTFFEDWEEGDASLERWGWNLMKSDGWRRIEEGFAVYGNHSLHLSSGNSTYYNCHCEGYKEVAINNSNPVFSAWLYPEKLSGSSSLEYAIDVNVSGEIFHLRYGAFSYLPADSPNTLYFPLFSADGRWHYICRSLRDDLLWKGVNVTEEILVEKISVGAYRSRADSEADAGAQAYFDGIAILSPSPVIADIGNASISVGFVQAQKGYHANSSSSLVVCVRNNGTADARNLSIVLAIKDENNASAQVTMQRKCCSVPHRSSRPFSFDWTPPYAGNYTVNVAVEIDGEIEAGNQTVIQVYLELEWKHNEPIELRCAGNLSDVAVPVILKPTIFDYTKANPDGSDIRIKDDNGADLPLWIENWNTSSESRIWTRLPISHSRTVYLWYGCENARTASNASAVASFFEDWSDYEDYGEYTYTGGMKGWRLQPYNANGFVRIYNASLNINVSSKMIGTYRNLHLNSDAPVLSSRLKVENGTGKAFVGVDVNVTGKIYSLRYGRVSGEEFDFNIVPADGEWHLIHRCLREDLEERGVAVDSDIEVKQVLLQVEGTGGDAYFDDTAIMESHSTLRVGGMQKPDLLVRFTEVPEEVRLNRTVPIAVEVLNLGVDAPEFNVSLSVNGELVYNLTLDGIKSMENATCTSNWKLHSLGPHTLEAFADSGKVIAEVEEGNNNASVDVEVGAPELFIADVQILKFADVSYCFANTSNNISIVMNNSGTADIDNESFNVSLAVGGTVVDEKRFNVSVERNETCILPFNWTPVASGDYMLSFNIDSHHEIDEVTESNNTFTMNVSVFKQTDIVIEKVKVHKKRYAGFMNPVRVYVRNKGDIGVSFNISFNAIPVGAGENETIEKRVCDLSANASEEVEFKWVPSHPGNYTLSIAVDSENEIAEQDEDNNLWSGTYEVKETDIIPPRPLVVMGNVSYEDGRPCSSASFSVNLTIINGATRKFSALTKNSTYLAVLPVRYNDRELGVSAKDYGGVSNDTRIEIEEDITGEGFLNLNITLPLEMPDIAVTKLHLYPLPPLMLNATCWVNATVENLGTNTNGSFNVSFEVKDEYGNVVENETKRLEPLDYLNRVKIPFSWMPSAPGRFTIAVVADADNDIEELTERNNNWKEEVAVASSDLTVDIEPPYDLFVNVSNEIIVTVRNIGDADISFAWDRFEQRSISVELRILKENTTVFRSYGQLNELNASENKTVTFDWQPSAIGKYTLKAIVDPSDDIVETNESNNEAETEREVYVPMDVGMLLYSGCGEPYYIKFKVITDSTLFNATWKGCTLIGEWEEQDQLVYTNDTGTITGVADIDNPQLWFYDNGTWGFDGTANASLALEDGQIFGWAPPGIDLSDPNLLLIPKPDFVPVAMEMPRTLYFGRQIPVKITVENHGLESNETEVELRVRAEGEDSWRTEDFDDSVFVPAHGNASLTLKWLAKEPGWHEILVVTDPNNRSDEIDETNNNMAEERVVTTGSIIDVPRDFPTIREAVEDAAPGTVIYVHEGRYNAYSWKLSNGRREYSMLNRVDIVDKNNITIIGDGWDTVLNSNHKSTSGKWWKPLINIINSSNITIMNIELIESGEQHELLHIENSRDITMENCKIKSTTGAFV
jgi:subtilase family serine protease